MLCGCKRVRGLASEARGGPRDDEHYRSERMEGVERRVGRGEREEKQQKRGTWAGTGVEADGVEIEPETLGR